MYGFVLTGHLATCYKTGCCEICIVFMNCDFIDFVILCFVQNLMSVHKMLLFLLGMLLYMCLFL